MPARPLHVFGSVVSIVVVAACAGDDGESTVPSSTLGPSTTVVEYPDAITREMQRQAAAIRPVEPSAIPPRHLDEDEFPVSLVDRERVVSGGPPADGIPSIDEPVFAPAGSVDWLAADEPVLVLRHDGVVRIYPTQVMIWHEIVNDEVAGTPVAVTYCPLCNSGIAYVRTIDGAATEFGTSGALFQSNLVMYDRLTESLWTQFDGRAVVGTSVGSRLDQLPLTTVAWSDAEAAHPDADVLTRDTGWDRPYGRNPYNAYDLRDEPLPGFFVGDVDGRLVPFERIIGIDVGDLPVAVRRSDVTDRGVVEFDIADRGVTVWAQPGARSPLNDGVITEGDEIGAVAAYETVLDDRVLSFRRPTDAGGGFVDEQTESTWNILGEATSGPLTGSRLDPVVHVDTFWFSWAIFQIETVVLDPDDG